MRKLIFKIEIKPPNLFLLKISSLGFKKLRRKRLIESLRRKKEDGQNER